MLEWLATYNFYIVDCSKEFTKMLCAWKNWIFC